MTLDEAIKRAEEVADNKEREKQKWERWLETYKDSDYRALNEKVSCEVCAKKHRQLAEWLKDYKRLLEQPTSEDCVSRQAVLDIISHHNHNFGVVAEIKALPPVTPTHGTCKDCGWLTTDEDGNYYCKLTGNFDSLDFYCADFERRGSEERW